VAKDATHRVCCFDSSLLENMTRTKYGRDEEIQPKHESER
jgi:hypothetical protein